MGLYDLVGKEITITTMGGRDGKTGVVIDKVKWLVVQAYPHYVRAVRTCENGTIITECFCKGELVQMGVLQSRKKSHYMVGEREGYRVEGKENR